MSDAHEHNPANGVERPSWEAAQPQRTPPAAHQKPSAKTTPTTLLLVDREPTLRAALERSADGPATVLYAENLAQARELIEAQPRIDIAVIAKLAVLAVGNERVAKLVPHFGRGIEVGGRAPIKGDFIGRLDGAPCVVGNHRNAAGNRDDFLNAAHGFGCSVIHRLHLAA